jgi:dipeptidyl aminopeptidase/acylaminoacyl peptidase
VIEKANAELQSGTKGENCKIIDGLMYSMVGKTTDSEKYEIGEMEAALRSISPITYIGDDALPAVFAYGEKDNLVRIYHADSLETRYQRHGGTFEMIRFPNSGHELGRDSECVERLNKTISVFAKKYFGY